MDTPIDQAVSKLEAIAAVRPDVAPVVDVALAVVRSAEDEVRKAGIRARVAEDTLADVTPEIKKIAIRAAHAEEELRLRDQLDANQAERDAAAKRERAEKAQESIALADAMASLTKAAAARGALIEKFVTCHAQVKPSLIEHRGAYGPFAVKYADGTTFAVCETRREALDAVDALLEVERKIPVGDDAPDGGDSEDSPRRRRQAQPGECAPPEDLVPGHAGRLDGRRIGKTRVTKRAPRIL